MSIKLLKVETVQAEWELSWICLQSNWSLRQNHTNGQLGDGGTNTTQITIFWNTSCFFIIANYFYGNWSTLMSHIFGRLSFLNSVYFLAMSIVLTMGPNAAAKNKSKKGVKKRIKCTSSKMCRKSKFAQVDLSISAMDTGGLLAPRISYSHFLSRNLVLQVGYSQITHRKGRLRKDYSFTGEDEVKESSPDDKLDTSDNDTTESSGFSLNSPLKSHYEDLVTEKALHFDLKNFYGNSFYGTMGITNRESHRILKYRSKEIEGEYRLRTLGVNTGIGNQWIMRYFTLGVDWVKYSHPIFTISKESSYNFDSLSEEDQVEAESRLNNPFQDGWTFGRLYMGYAF